MKKDIFQMVKEKGLKIEYFKTSAPLSAFVVPSKKIIYVNEDQTQEKKVFSIAHELGHFVLNHQKMEEEADAFARNLLLV